MAEKRWHSYKVIERKCLTGIICMEYITTAAPVLVFSALGGCFPQQNVVVSRVEKVFHIEGLVKVWF